jgi:hypothetical protein
MRRHFNLDGEAVSKSLGVNAAIGHQGHLDFVEHDGDATAVKVLGQVPNGEANAGGFHGEFSERRLPCQLRSGGEAYPVNSTQFHTVNRTLEVCECHPPPNPSA